MNWPAILTAGPVAAVLLSGPWLYREMRWLISRRILMLDVEEVLSQEDER